MQGMCLNKSRTDVDDSTVGHQGREKKKKCSAHTLEVQIDMAHDHEEAVCNSYASFAIVSGGVGSIERHNVFEEHGRLCRKLIVCCFSIATSLMKVICVLLAFMLFHREAKSWMRHYHDVDRQVE